MKKIFTSIAALTLVAQVGFAQIPSANLVGEWLFDGDGTDGVGNVDATITGAVPTPDRFGNPSSAYQFSSAATYMNLGDNFDQYLSMNTGAISYSFWVNFDAVNVGNQPLLAKTADGGCAGDQRQIIIRLNESQLEVIGYGSLGPGNFVGVKGATNLAANQWYHVTVVYHAAQITINNSAAAFSIYVNGVAETLSVSTTGGSQLFTFPGIYDGTAHLGIGISLNTSGGVCYSGAYLQGKFDDLRIYSSVLDVTAVNQLYNEANILEPVAIYDFNDGTANDQSGNGNHGTAISTTTTLDRFGNADAAYHFDGSTSIVEMTDGLLLNPNMAISLWFKTTSEGAILGYQNNNYPASGANWVPVMYAGTDNTLHATMWSGSVINLNPNNTVYNDGQWHHVVLTGDASIQQLYIDNTPIGAGTGITVIPTMIKNQLGVANTGSSWAGANSGWFFFEGDIDDVYIYHRMISLQDVADLYNMGNTVTGVSTEEKSAFAVYPNPTTDVINIRSEAAFSQVNVLDMTGRTVLNIAETNINKLDLSNFDRGIYFLQFVDGETIRATERIVLQ